MKNKQAVVETAMGTIVIDLRPDLAPNHVGYFMRLASEGAYKGTVFHRVIRNGIIQGGDPLSKDPGARDRYGTGGLNRLKPEPNPQKHTRGAVSAVLVPGKPDSAGTQTQVNELLRWNGTAWQVVNRAAYCESGGIPSVVAQKACQVK